MSSKTEKLKRVGGFLWKQIGVLILIAVIAFMFSYYSNLLGFTAWVDARSGTLGVWLTSLASMVESNPFIATYILGLPWFAGWMMLFGSVIGMAFWKYVVVAGKLWGFNATMDESGKRIVPGADYVPPHTQPNSPPAPEQKQAT